MSRPLDTQQLVRASWLTELRRQEHRQCHGSMNGPDRTVCALQLLDEISGRSRSPYVIGQTAGLDRWQTWHVVSLNDGAYGHKHTFAEIADVVEGWFK